MDSDLGLKEATNLSKKPCLEPPDKSVVTEIQQRQLNVHKVRIRLL